ncbi:MAG: response regulator [Bacilli bacterium]|nr:response regulator [Bacilli bacterium]
MIGVSFSVCCFIFLLILLLFYFSKERLNNLNNKLFTILLVINIIGIFIDISGYASFKYLGIDNNINVFISKIYLIYYLTYVFCFMLYIYNVSTNNLKKMSKKFIILFLTSCMIDLFLPIGIHFDGNIGFSYGMSVNFAYALGGIMIFAMLFCLIKNVKKIGYKEYIPLIVFVFLTIFTIVIQKINPQITMLLLSNTTVTYLMYFTIENPDMQMMEELYKNKKLIEKSNEDTSNFLFRMTQDIKKPIKDIIDVSSDMFDIKDISELMEGTKIINNKARELDYLVNDALDVSRMNTDTIKVYDTRYNVLNLFNEIKFQTQNKLDDGVKFEYSISNNLPLYLYGDSIKLKQVIYSILDNSISNTSSGYISLNINSIIKYDICRLIINIADSGKGMDIEEVNNILSLNIDDLSKIDISSDKKNYNLKEIKKLVTFLGGNLIVKSGEGKGTEVSITIDQKIVRTKDNEISKKLDLYEQSIQSGKKIMVVDDDAKELSKITTYLEEKDISVSGSLFGRDVINKISSKQNFDLIILDDETDTASAYEVLMELKKNPKFNIPVVIMIDDSKEFIRLHFLKDGFADVILKSKLNSELDRILKRF